MRGQEVHIVADGELRGWLEMQAKVGRRVVVAAPLHSIQHGLKITTQKWRVITEPFPHPKKD
jgi:hypothetical protein